MWLFLPLGLLMPASVPTAKVDPKWLGPEGKYDIQVRVRDKSHVENFIRDYLDPMGLPHSDIQDNPDMDYNHRIYMDKGDFAKAIAQATLDIDYEKFKPTAERRDAEGHALYPKGRIYHDVLNSVWGTVCKLGTPGGVWGTYSKTNPKGQLPYKGKGRYSGYSYDGRYAGVTGGIKAVGLHSDLDGIDNSFRDYELGVPDYISEEYLEGEMLVDELMNDGIPRGEWEMYLDDREMVLVRKYEAAQDMTPLAFFDDDPEPVKPKQHGRRAKSKKGKNGRRFFQKR